ncbi:hypothetical protein [Acidovorax temperans]|uniref:hypothetical protein n=1 Tax=Acidovorax temperans TaxID=80878 RepID=UPI0030CB85EA
MKDKKSSSTTFKPSVAFDSEQEGRANIELKIEFLMSVIRREAASLTAVDIPDERFFELLKTLPDSKRKFNGLSTDGLADELKGTYPIFRSNAPITLRRHPDLTDRVEKVLDAIRQAVEALSQPPKKVVKVAALSRQLKLANNLREIAEETLYAQKRELETLRADVVSYKNKLESLRRAAEENAVVLRQEIKRLKGEAAKETAQGPKVVPLPTRPARK